jgi:imidazolonepropionase-like amidohydrolase
MKKIIKTKILIDGTGSKPIENAAIIIDKGIIENVTFERSLSGYEEAEMIDASDKTALPGLIDGHVHVAWGTEEKPGWNQVFGNEQKLLMWAVRGVNRLLTDGITTARDCGGPGQVPFLIRNGIDAGLIPGPKLLVAGPVLTTTAGHCHFFGIESNTADELRAGVRQMVQQGVDFIKIMATGGTLTPMSNRRRAQYSVDELTAAVEDAHRLNKRVVTHGNATEGIRNAVRAGVDSIAHCNWLGVEDGTLEYDEEVVKEMADKGIYIDLNIAPAITPIVDIDGFAQDWGDKTRWDLMRDMQAAGIRIYLTTDAIGPMPGEFTDLLVKMVSGGYAAAAEIIPMITRIPARAMGIGDEAGTLEPGKIADLILLDGNPLEDITALKRIDSVFRSGQLCVSKGNLVLPTNNSL